MKLSVITPCYNEELNIPLCAQEVRRVITESLPDWEYEHIFCDNASTDDSRAVLRELASTDPNVKVIINSKNVGPFRNIANGLRSVSGDCIVPMVAADLQDPPAVIPRMIDALEKDIDVVYGIRTNRRESFLMRKARGAYYAIVRASGGESSAPAHAGEFLLVRKNVLDNVIEVMGSYPYIRGLIAQATERVATVQFEWGERQIGKSRNTIASLVDQALNGIISTARAPIRIALLLGSAFASLGILYGIASLLMLMFGQTDVDPGIPTLIVAVFVFCGLQLLFLGLIGEYVVSIQSEVRPSPRLVEVERINF